MTKEKQHIFDSPENIRILLHVFYAICLGLLLIDFIYHRHVIHAWEALWGAGCEGTAQGAEAQGRLLR